MARLNFDGNRLRFDQGVQIPQNDTAAIAQEPAEKLESVDPDLQRLIVDKFGQSGGTIGGFWGLLRDKGTQKLAQELAEGSQIPAAELQRTLGAIYDSLSVAASYELLEPSARPLQRLFLTESGQILLRANEAPPADVGSQADRLHYAQLTLAEYSRDQKAQIPEATRVRTLQAAIDLVNRVTGGHGTGGGNVRLPVYQGPPQALKIPDNSGWVHDELVVAEAGLLEKIAVTVDIPHSYIGDLQVELVAPDGTTVSLHDNAGGASRNLKKTYTMDQQGLAVLRGTQVQGAWRIRVKDTAPRDEGELKGWKLELETRGQEPGDPADPVAATDADKRKILTSAATIARLIATRSETTPEEKAKAFDLLAEVLNYCPYEDAKGIIVGSIYQQRDQLAPAERARFDSEIVPKVVQKSPNYYDIYKFQRNDQGQLVPTKRELNSVRMCGYEEDDGIYRGVLRMMEQKGYTKVESDIPGFVKFTKKVNQDDPSAPCQQINEYVGRMDGRNMLKMLGEEKIDLVVYDGHSNLGRNIEDSLRYAPALAGSKVFVGGACATTDRVFAIRQQFPDRTRLQISGTLESTFFNMGSDEQGKILEYSENQILSDGLVDGMSRMLNWMPSRPGEKSLHDAQEQATHSYGHTVDVNYTNPGIIEDVLKLEDLDRNGRGDWFQLVWDGRTVDPGEDVQNAFTPKAPPSAVGDLIATKCFRARHSLDTFGRYNPVVKKFYRVRDAMRSLGYVETWQDKPVTAESPMVMLAKDPRSGQIDIAFNPYYSHTDAETMRMEAHWVLAKAAIDDFGNSTQYPDMRDDLGKRILALLFVAASLKYDNAQGYMDDERRWNGFLQHHGLPALPFRIFERVLDHEHYQPWDELCGNPGRNIKWVKEGLNTDGTTLSSLSAEQLAALAAAPGWPKSGEAGGAVVMSGPIFRPQGVAGGAPHGLYMRLSSPVVLDNKSYDMLFLPNTFDLAENARVQVDRSKLRGVDWEAAGQRGSYLTAISPEDIVPIA